MSLRRRRTPRRLALLVALWPALATAQSAAMLRLGAPNANLAEEFSNLTWVRELGDGRVIVSDGRDGRVVVADLRSGSVEQIGRKGQGPGEYPRALPVWSIGRDSSVMIGSPARWLVFSGARIATTLAPDAPAVAALKGITRGVDTLGYAYSADFVRGGGSRPIGDSTVLIRVARASGRVDTIAKLAALVPRRTSAPDKNGFFSFSLPTIAAADEAVPFPDGWVAIVRTEPYRVEWRTSDGRWVRNGPLPFTAVRMDDKEKRAYMERLANATGKTPSPPDSITDWPATVPPYRSPLVLIAASDGRVLVPRMPTADHPETRYDVVNRRGTLDGQVVLPPNERIVDVGGASVYVGVTDDDGIQRLRRHPWPPPARPR